MGLIGYCCINLSLNDNLPKKKHVLVNRGTIKKTFNEKGLKYVSELTILNLKDLITILYWNIKHDIKLYRMSSNMFPWLTEYNIEDLPDFEIIKNLLKQIGDIIKSNGLRVGFHPGPFNVLASLNEDVVKKTIHELNFTSKIMDYMGLDLSPYYYINIHINTTKPSKELSCERFCNNFQLLDESTKKRLTIENDDKESQYSVKDLYEMIYSKIKIPIVMDFLHFDCGKKDLSLLDSLKLALSTWKTTPITHMSSSKILEKSESKKSAHSDYIYETIPYFNKFDFDCELESKMKDKSVLKYIKDFK